MISSPRSSGRIMERQYSNWVSQMMLFSRSTDFVPDPIPSVRLRFVKNLVDHSMSDIFPVGIFLLHHNAPPVSKPQYPITSGT